MKELNVSELPRECAYTGEIGARYVDGRWERNGQQLLCPLTKLVIEKNPETSSWLRAACLVTGWSLTRTFAFKTTMGGLSVAPGKGTTDEAAKGITDARLFRLLHKLARSRHQRVQSV